MQKKAYPQIQAHMTPKIEKCLAISLLVAIAIYYLVMTILNLTGYFEYRVLSMTDSAIFRHIGRRMSDGAVLYSDIWDCKGPMLFMTYYWGYLFSNGSAWGLEIAILIYSLTASWCCFYAMRYIAGPLPAALGVVLMTLSVGSVGWCGTSTESNYILWSVIGLAIVLPAQGRGGRWGWRWVIPGGLVAFCVLTKPNFVGFGCFLLMFWGMEARAHRNWKLFLHAAAASAAGFFAVLITFAIGMWFKGNLLGMVDASILFCINEYHSYDLEWRGLPKPFGQLRLLLGAEFLYFKGYFPARPWILAMVLCSLSALWVHRREANSDTKLYVSIIVWIVMEFLTAGVKYVIYPHYYDTLMLPFCLLAVSASRTLRRQPLLRHALMVLILLAIPWRHSAAMFPPLGGNLENTMKRDALVAKVAKGLNPNNRAVAVLGAASAMRELNRLNMYSRQHYLPNSYMLKYNISDARREELLNELKDALELAAVNETFLLTDKPLLSYIEENPELEPILRGWRAAIDESAEHLIFIYLPPVLTSSGDK